MDLRAIENIHSAFSSIFQNKLRYALAMLGIIMGVAAIICVFAMGAGGGYMVEKEGKNFGTNVVVVSFPFTERNMKKTTPEAILPLFSHISLIKNAVPVVHGFFSVRRGNKTKPTMMSGTNEGYASAKNVELVAGRFITEDDVRLRKKVCVLDRETAEALFGNENPVGGRIYVEEIPFEVIGLMKEKVSSVTELVKSEQPGVVPLSFVQSYFGRKDMDFVLLEIERYETLDETVAAIRETLLQEGFTEKMFSVFTLKDVVESIKKIIATFSALIGGVGLVSLIVGGVGIMNIMFIAVVERTSEIGVRMAVGATREDILLQFLAESVFIGLLGGMMGIVVGALGSKIASLFFEWPLIITVKSVAFGFFASFITGVIFGILPAKQAADLLPVEALRQM